MAAKARPTARPTRAQTPNVRRTDQPRQKTSAHASPRTVVRVQHPDLAVPGDQDRLHAGELSAEITAHAAADLDVRVGTEVDFVVKATEVAVYAT